MEVQIINLRKFFDEFDFKEGVTRNKPLYYGGDIPPPLGSSVKVCLRGHILDGGAGRVLKLRDRERSALVHIKGHLAWIGFEALKVLYVNS